MVCKTIFITGAEGVGKSSIVKLLKTSFPDIDIRDFDEVGVPDNPPLSWRLKITKYWLDLALANKNEGISSCIVGLSFPDEILSFKESNELDLEFILLDVSIQERANRLKNREATDEIILDLDCYYSLKDQFTDNVIDTTNLSVENVEKQVTFLIENFFIQ